MANEKENTQWDKLSAVTQELAKLMRENPWVRDTQTWKNYAALRNAIDPLADELESVEVDSIVTAAEAVRQLVRR